MARESFADQNIPTPAANIPYADFRQIARGFAGLRAEMFVGQITGAGGVGGTLAIPFDPVVVITMETTNAASKITILIVPTSVQLIVETGLTTTGLSVEDDADSKPRVVTMTTAKVPDADVAEVICFGVPEIEGTL